MLLSGKLKPATVTVPFEVEEGVLVLPTATAVNTTAMRAATKRPELNLRFIFSLSLRAVCRSNVERTPDSSTSGRFERGRPSIGGNPQETNTARREQSFHPGQGKLRGQCQESHENCPGEHPRGDLRRVTVGE